MQRLKESNLLKLLTLKVIKVLTRLLEANFQAAAIASLLRHYIYVYFSPNLAVCVYVGIFTPHFFRPKYLLENN